MIRTEIDSLTDEEMNATVAEILEPSSTLPDLRDDVDYYLPSFLAGERTFSPEGVWQVVCIYDEGDIPRWDPMPCISDPALGHFLLTKITERGYWVSTHLSASPHVHMEIVRVRVRKAEHGESIVDAMQTDNGDERIPVEKRRQCTFCRAICKAIIELNDLSS